MRKAKTSAAFGTLGLPAVGKVKALLGPRKAEDPTPAPDSTPSGLDTFKEDLRKALNRRPRGVWGRKWTRGDERQFEAIRDSCLAEKPRCSTKYTKGQRVRKCYRDCQRVATTTVNKRRREQQKGK